MLIRFFATVLALAVATLALPGIEMTSNQLSTDVLALIGVAIIFGIVNSVVKPLFTRYAQTPLGLVALGVFLLVLNAALLGLTSLLCSIAHIPWRVDDPISAFVGAFIVSVVSFVVNSLFGRRGTEHR